jgi:hypothetical protein
VQPWRRRTEQRRQRRARRRGGIVQHGPAAGDQWGQCCRQRWGVAMQDMQPVVAARPVQRRRHAEERGDADATGNEHVPRRPRCQR